MSKLRRKLQPYSAGHAATCDDQRLERLDNLKSCAIFAMAVFLNAPFGVSVVDPDQEIALAEIHRHGCCIDCSPDRQKHAQFVHIINMGV